MVATAAGHNSAASEAARLRHNVARFAQADSRGGLQTLDDAIECAEALHTIWQQHAGAFASPLDIFQMAVMVLQRSLLQPLPPLPSNSTPPLIKCSALVYFVRACRRTFSSVLSPLSEKTQNRRQPIDGEHQQRLHQLHQRHCDVVAVFWRSALSAAYWAFSHEAGEAEAALSKGTPTTSQMPRLPTSNEPFQRLHAAVLEVVQTFQSVSTVFAIPGGATPPSTNITDSNEVSTPAAAAAAVAAPKAAVVVELALSILMSCLKRVVTVAATWLLPSSSSRSDNDDDVWSALEPLLAVLKTLIAEVPSTMPPSPAQHATLMAATAQLAHALYRRVVLQPSQRMPASDAALLHALLPSGLQPNASAADQRRTWSYAEATAWVMGTMRQDARHVATHRDAFLHGVPSSLGSPDQRRAAETALMAQAPSSSRGLEQQRGTTASISILEQWLACLLSLWSLCRGRCDEATAPGGGGGGGALPVHAVLLHCALAVESRRRCVALTTHAATDVSADRRASTTTTTDSAPSTGCAFETLLGELATSASWRSAGGDVACVADAIVSRCTMAFLCGDGGGNDEDQQEGGQRVLRCREAIHRSAHDLALAKHHNLKHYDNVAETLQLRCGGVAAQWQLEELTWLLRVLTCVLDGDNPRMLLWTWWTTASVPTATSQPTMGADVLTRANGCRCYSDAACEVSVSLVFVVALSIADVGGTSWFLDMALPTVLHFCSDGGSRQTRQQQQQHRCMDPLTNPMYVVALSRLVAEVVGALSIEGDVVLARSLMWTPLLLACHSPTVAAMVPLRDAVVPLVTVACYTDVPDDPSAAVCVVCSTQRLTSAREVVCTGAPPSSSSASASSALAKVVSYVPLCEVASLRPMLVRGLLVRFASSIPSSHTKPHRALLVFPLSTGDTAAAVLDDEGDQCPLLRRRTESLQALSETTLRQQQLRQLRGASSSCSPLDPDNAEDGGGIAISSAGASSSCLLEANDVLPYARTRSVELGRTFAVRRRLAASLQHCLQQRGRVGASVVMVDTPSAALREGTMSGAGVAHDAATTPTAVCAHVALTVVHGPRPHSVGGPAGERQLRVRVVHAAPAWLWDADRCDAGSRNNAPAAPPSSSSSSVDADVATTDVSSLGTTTRVAHAEVYLPSDDDDAACSNALRRIAADMEDIYRTNKAMLSRTSAPPSYQAGPHGDGLAASHHREQRRAFKVQWWASRAALDARLGDVARGMETSLIPPTHHYALLPLPQLDGACGGWQQLAALRATARRAWEVLRGPLSFVSMAAWVSFPHVVLLANWALWTIEATPTTVVDNNAPPPEGPHIQREAFAVRRVAAVLRSWVLLRGDGDDLNDDAAAIDATLSDWADHQAAALVHNLVASSRSTQSSSSCGGEKNTTSVATNNDARRLLYLAMSNELHALPWEATTLMGGIDCIRTPVGPFPHPVHAQQQQQQQPLSPARVLYLCNPTGDLDKTERRFASAFKRHIDGPHWFGACGPSATGQWTPHRLLQATASGGATSDVLLYMGHGGGECVLPRSVLYDMMPPPAPSALLPVADAAASSSPPAVPPFVLLMGCCSAKSTVSPLHFDPYAMPFAWLHAGATAVVGALLHVSDGEIDRLTTDLVRRFLNLLELDAGDGGVGAPVEAAGGALDSADDEASSDAEPAPQERDSAAALSSAATSMDEAVSLTPQRLASALRTARRVCKFKYLTGAVTVCYGMPPS